MRLGLRIDVDTFRGTRDGVPWLSRFLASRGVRATFFFSVGPDNMGRHLWRMLHPSFAWKMLRSNAPGLYGWDILLRGTLWPGPQIGDQLADVIRETAAAGHEIGLHAWDHHAWQAGLDRWTEAQLDAEIDRGVAKLTAILGRPPTCSAAPAWKCDERVVAAKQRHGFVYNSDCRGSEVFTPAVGPAGSGPSQPQVPVTLPTYDELVGTGGVTRAGFFPLLAERLRPEMLNVVALHAEVEGIALRDEFEEFVDRLQADGWTMVTLGTLARAALDPPLGRIERGSIPGRAGWLARQAVGA